MPREITTEYFSGQGIVYLAELLNEVPQGFVDVGNCPDLKVSLEVSTFEKKESRSGSRLTSLRQTTDKKANIALVLDSFSKENLQKALFGALTSVTATPVTGSPVTARLGKVVPLPDIKVGSVTIKGTGDDSAITYELNKNYTINLDAGSIYFMTAAEQTAASAAHAIDEADALAVDYTPAAQVKIESFGAAEKEYALRIEGLNTADANEPVVVTAHRVRLSPLKTLALISDETGTLDLEAPVLATTVGNKFVTIQKL
jgi:hypothetical protein